METKDIKEIKLFTAPRNFRYGKVTAREIQDGILTGFLINIYEDHGKTMCHIFDPKFTEKEAIGLIGEYNEDLKEGTIVDYLVKFVAEENADYCMKLAANIFFQQTKARTLTEDDLIPKLKNLPKLCHMFEAQRIIDKTVKCMDEIREKKYGSGHNLIMETIIKGVKNNYLGAYKKYVTDAKITATPLTIPKMEIEGKTANPDGRGGLGDGNK